MKELPNELKQFVKEAEKDKEWAKELRGAGSAEKFEELLKQKGIELSEKAKDELRANGAAAAGKLEDSDLENVTGGWINIFNCPREYNNFLCELTFCPHIQTRDYPPDESQYEKYCDLGYWSIYCSYLQRP